MRKEFLPFSRPDIGSNEIEEVIDTLKSGWITTGPKTRRFEELFAEYVGSSDALAVSSCTAGLHLALAALGVGPGDEVIAPSMTFCSTINEIVHLGATPVLVDCRDDLNIDPAEVERAISPRTKVVLPVHHGGQPCDLEEIYRLASAHDIAIVEDAAHAAGAEYRSLKIGSDELPSALGESSLRRITVFSFYANKNMTTGEGGMVTTRDQELLERMRILSLHGMSRDAWKRHAGTGSWYYEVVSPGYKYNMSDILAAIGVHQLARLDGFIQQRAELAAHYDALFDGTDNLSIPIAHPDRKHAWHLYVIRVHTDRLSIERGEFIERLRRMNIGCSVHFVPVHTHPFYRETYGYESGALPVSERLFQQIISLPLFPLMTPDDVEYVADAVKEVLISSAL